MDNPQLAARIVASCRECLPDDTPLVVKFRSGYTSVNYLEFGLKMQEAGADILILHPRNRAQMFTGHSTWSQITKLKQACDLPVVGNGDVFSRDDIRKMKQETGCDSVMIGRGAIGNPWVFAQKSPTNQEKLDTIKEHYHLAIQHYGKTKGVQLMRAHIAKYTKNIIGGSKARQEINTITSLEKIFATLERLFLI